ncbi:Hypothetical predicted protein [Octopus vulgaris]|uniref:Uncharacterized protein n=1 Tax=Octopus vulgaris TaxID=6645 RepID=A0AA36AT15_OCTVU|nr:Hypothetical predicted protein [Octopus vulgaris]
MLDTTMISGNKQWSQLIVQDKVTLPDMNQVALAIGSNKGIGFAIVRALCKRFEGDVIATACDVGRGEAAIAELSKEGCQAKLTST